jgi:hypothetical protein
MKPSPPQTVRCGRCGSDQRFAPGVSGMLCRACTGKIVLRAALTSSEPPGSRWGRPQSAAPSRDVMRKHSKKRALLDGTAAFEELRALQRQLSWTAAFVPFLGPWLIQWKELKTQQEKKQLRRRCLLVANFTLSCLTALVIAGEPRRVPPDKRAEAEIRVLGGIVQEFRARTGAYPDVAAWARTLDLGDPRYLDPWGRPYLYIGRNDHAMIGTLGRDNVEGGTGPDSDVWQTFAPEAASS